MTFFMEVLWKTGVYPEKKKKLYNSDNDKDN